MNKTALVLLTVVLLLFISGCEFLGIVEISIRNNSSESILYIYSSVYGEELHLDSEWERDDVIIPVGSYRRVFFQESRTRLIRAESANMFWEYSFSPGDAQGGDTLYWILTDVGSSPKE